MIIHLSPLVVWLRQLLFLADLERFLQFVPRVKDYCGEHTKGCVGEVFSVVWVVFRQHFKSEKIRVDLVVVHCLVLDHRNHENGRKEKGNSKREE